MTSKLENLLSEVQRKTTPSREEQKRILVLAKKLRQRVEETAKEIGVDVEVRVEGSVAKNTWLKESPEIDVFIRVSPAVPRKTFGTTYLDIAKKATAGARQVERFAEHPYLEVFLDGARVNVVPCYKIENGEWKSATDRTPFHTDYVKPLLSNKLCGEIRLLKRFMKGINVYGAEIRIGGFSGYLCELLILNYKSFLRTLKAASDWKVQTLIDLEGYYRDRETEMKLIFEGPLVMVDPVDKGRNAASAVRRERLDELIAASRIFLEKPNIEFFYPSETRALDRKELSQIFENRGAPLVFVQFGKVNAVPDILWGQLYKSQRSLRKLVERHGFRIIRNGVWSDEKELNVFLLEVEHQHLPSLKKHLGPPLERKSECKRFLQKHANSSNTLSGPRVEEGRWIVEVKRKYVDIVKLLEATLRKGGRNSGIAELVSHTVARSLKILINEEILPTYSGNREFAEFLTEYLEGKPKWL